MKLIPMNCVKKNLYRLVWSYPTFIREMITSSSMSISVSKTIGHVNSYQTTQYQQHDPETKCYMLLSTGYACEFQNYALLDTH